MRHIILGGLLILSLSACNMTTASQSGAESLTTNTPIPTVTPQPPFVTQDLTTQTSAPAAGASQQNTGAAQQNVASQNNTSAQQSVAAAQQNTVACTPINDGWQTYTVVAGDTLSQIARQVSVTTERLAQANCLRDANSLTVGQTLLVPVMPNLVTVPDVGRLRTVGDFMGAPDPQGCWASNKGGTPLVYDAINGTPIAVLSNRVPIIVASSAEWVQVYLNGTKTIPETTGWMRTADISLIGACANVGIPNTGNLRIVGDFAGTPDLNSCWASNPGNSPVVYDAINGSPIAVLSNRVSVIAANSTDWVQVFLMGDKFIADATGWMRTADVSLIGACAAVTGVPMYIGNPAGIPDGLCVVVIPTPESIVPVYTTPGGQQIGTLGGWALWVSTQGSYYQIQFNGPSTGGSPNLLQAWVEVSKAQRANC